jgi:hypothetical protein
MIPFGGSFEVLVGSRWEPGRKGACTLVCSL